MICQDWRDAPSSLVDDLYLAERERWIRDLGWETSEIWSIVEAGRQSGHVPGWLAVDKGEVAGWTFYILHDAVLQIGGLTARRPAIGRRLLDTILASPEAALAKSLACFVFPEGGALGSALRRQRFGLRDTLYLSRPISEVDLAPETSMPESVRSWRDGDMFALVRLLMTSYQDVPGAQAFAPGGRRDQWARYAGQLLRTPACGVFDPGLTFVAHAQGTGDPCGVVLTTRIAPDTVHIAQVAVAPEHRRRGLAEHLVRSAIGASASSGARAVTLMVDGENHPARTLYERLGFTERARFLYGSRGARRDTTKVLKGAEGF